MVAPNLAVQLSKGISLNAPLLADGARRKHVESYLFTVREADQHDFHSIHALGVNGLSKLKTLDVKFAKYDKNLFSDVARGLDRTLQSDSQNAELDRTICSFLRDLGPYLLEAPTSKVLEWVVKRFRVNEFNVDAVMALFLPYHETAHFAKMVSILHVKESNLWSFLSPLKAAAKPLPRAMLVDEMVTNSDLVRFMITLLPDAIGAGRTYRTLISFTASVTTGYLSRLKNVDEEGVAFILPALTRCFAPDSNQDCTLASYVTLAVLSRCCRLSSQALVAVLVEMLKGQEHVRSQQILPFLVAVAVPQDILEEFPDSMVRSIMALPGAINLLTDCFIWVGAEKLVLPLLPSLVRRASEVAVSDILNSMLLSPSVPAIVLERCTELLLDDMLKVADRSDSTLLRLLTTVFQRHGTIFSEVSSRLMESRRDENDRKALEELLSLVTLPSSSTGGCGKWILSSHAIDISSRVTAVRELAKALAAGIVEPEGHEDLYDALRARVMDTNPTVIEALYSVPGTILPVICNVQFIEGVSSALTAPDVSRTIMRLHFAFVAGEFYDHSPELAPTMLERVYLPYILFTKPRQKTATLVWQSLHDSKFSQYELLKGCTDIVFAHSVAEGVSRSVEQMASLNLAVTSCIAGNIVASNMYPRHLDMLLRLLTGSDAHTTNICYLIIRSLLSQLSGEHQVAAAQRILLSMGLQSLDGLQGAMASATNLQDIISDDALLKSVVLKPSSIGTVHRLQVSILALLPVIQRPTDARIDWLGDGPLDSSDTRGKRFVELAHAIYTLANSSSATQFLSTSLLKALFVTIREQALQFLAGVWTASLLSDRESTGLPYAALSHARAFLQAQVADVDNPQDFQVILPSLLIALRSKQRVVRSAAMDCITIISQSSSSTTASPSIYALDSIYGSHSDGLQYLEWLDFGRCVSSLDEHREHFINDGDYLGVYIQEVLRKLPSDNKKEAGYKQRVLCYTLSHAITWTSMRARVALLKILRNVPNRVKLQMLHPLIHSIFFGDQTQNPWDEEDNSMGASYLQLLLEAYDETTAPDLNEPGSGSWTTFVRLVRLMFVKSNTPLTVRKTIVQQLCGGLFDLLTMDLQREICIVLIESAASSPGSRSMVKEAMGLLLKDAALIMSLLSHLQPTVNDSSQRAPKRPKLTRDLDLDPAELSLGPLTVLGEILVAHVMPGSVELMSTALDALARVCHTHSSQSDANYLMQLLMSTLESIAIAITDTTTLAPNSVRMEILVELLRVSDNPQTFNQALLLIANLARLAPEFVMQNVMPVFTFMGSNVFHRDDSYSFRVVQRTVDSIVPVVVNSLKTKHQDPLGLQIASRELLRVFTDATTHIPRHRRIQFFNHLVDVLGRDEFAASICLLLVDKVTNRIVRQKPGETANALGLPLAILRANFKATPFKVIEELLQEITRLVDRVTDVGSIAQDAFIELPQDEDQTNWTSTKRQMQAILIFVDLVLQQSPRRSGPSDGTAIQESVRLLLSLANLDKKSATSPEFAELSRAALKALSHLLRVISATEFASTIGTILETNNSTVENGAMNLLASRLANITPKTRQEISHTLTSIIEYFCNKLKASQEASTFRAVLNALRAIAQTADSPEIPALTKALPLILEVGAKEKTFAADVLKCILPLSAKIGPRILPFFRNTVVFCGGVLQDAQASTEGDSQRTEQDAQAVLVALLSSMPQFWGIDELVRLGELSLGARAAFISIRKTMAKRISAKQLLPALFRLWSDLTAIHSSSWSSREAFLELFKRVVRQAPRDDVHDHLRDIFKLFLEAFDMCSGVNRQEWDKFESLALTAFVDVVTKLNESAFKPLFRRLFDWAFNDATGKLVDRRTIFSRLLTALIKLLKGLVTPYMGVVLVPLTELLDSFLQDRKQSGRLWVSVVELFQTSLTFDEGAFWREDKLRKLMLTLIAQVEICSSLTTDDARHTLQRCLGALATAMDDDSSLKTLNLQLLMQTRSDDAQVRLFALECAENLWHGNSDKLSGFVSDVVTFIAECADDEHDEVAKAARGLKRTVEKRCGSLDVLMQ